MKQTIEGIIVLDNKAGKFKFLDGFPKDVFVDGLFRTAYSDLTYVADHTIEFETAPEFDPVKEQLNSLDAQEKEENFQHVQKLKAIQDKRQELLAIGND